MKQLPEGTGLRRIVLVGIFLLAALAGPAWADEQAEEIASAQYEAALLGGARLDFYEFFIDGDVVSGFWPDWLVRVFKVGGEWSQSVSAWFVPKGQNGQLCVVLDPAAVNASALDLRIEFYDGPPESSSLYVDLVDQNERVLLTSEVCGNMIEGSEMIVQRSLIVPLHGEYSKVRGVYLRGHGGVFVLGVSLASYWAEEISGRPEVADSGTPEAGQTGSGEPLSGRARPPAEPMATSPAGRGSVPHRAVAGAASLQSQVVKSITLPQFVMSRMADTDFVMTRDSISASGGRKTSPFFILEDSFGQASVVGFSFGGNFNLRAGYQQAEAEPLFIWNVGVAPPVSFNPTLGEGVVLSYVLSTEARVTVDVSDQGGAVIRNLGGPQAQNRGIHAVDWNGRNNAGNLVAPGTYWFNINAVNSDGVEVDSQMQIIVDNNIPVIRAVNDTPDPFEPAVDGNTTISFVTDAPVNDRMNLRVEIHENNLGGPVVRVLNRNNEPIGPNFIVWDGTDGINPVPDGLYVYTIDGRTRPPPAPPLDANQQTGTILLRRINNQQEISADGRVDIWHPGISTIAINFASPAEMSDALFAIRTADPGLRLQSLIYRIEATPSTTFTPPALMTFQYDPAIIGDIDDKLQIRRYNATTGVWDVPNQFVDYANNQIVAEIGALSLFALFTGADTTPPVIEIISPEAREYYNTAAIDILYEVEDPVMSGVSSGVAEVFVYLNGQSYTNASISPSDLHLGTNALTVVAMDGAGNIGRAGVIFTVILEAQVTLKPEALNVNPGILTAFVRLPEGWPAAKITSAICDGALYERMMLSDDATEMIIKFRRKDIEDALAETGEAIDTFFVVRGTYTDETGTLVFEGTDEISKIVGK